MSEINVHFVTEWPRKAIQKLTLEEKPDGSAELGLVVLVAVKPNPQVPSDYKAIGVAVPLTVDERKDAIRVLRGNRIDEQSNKLDGANPQSKGEASVETHPRNPRDGRPGSTAKKAR